MDSSATLGVTTSVPSPELALEMGLEFLVRQQGRRIDSVDEGSPASLMGIRVGDVLLKLGGTTLYSQDDINDFLSVHPSGTRATLTLVRAGMRQRDELSVALETGALVPSSTIPWRFASLSQLPAALDRARAEKKRLLVGLSGAET